MSWLSELIKGVKQTEKVDFVISGPLSGAASSAPLQAGGTYVTIRATSLRLPYTRQNVVEKVYGLIHAFVRLPSRGGQSSEFAAATMPSKLAGVDPKSLQNVVMVDKSLAGPTPWAGGELSIQIGVFSVVSENLAGPFLETISQLTDKVGVAFAATAKTYVDVIQFGVQALTRAKDSVKLEAGLDRSFGAPVTGHYAVVAAATNSLDTSKLTVEPASGRLLLDGALYTAKPYLVFEIESSTQRADWGEIPELRESYEAVRAAMNEDDQAKTKEAFGVFRRKALLSRDLIPDDADRLVEQVDKEIKRIFGTPNVSGRAAGPKAFEELGLYD